MAYDDKYRLSAHGIFINEEDQKVLLVKATYGDFAWHFPGGSLEPGETIHEALIRECKEELDVDVEVLYMSGMYFHKAYQSHACMFRCNIITPYAIKLSWEHSDYGFFNIDKLNRSHKMRVLDCLSFDGKVKSGKF